MPVKFEGKEYLIGPVEAFHSCPRSLTHIGSAKREFSTVPVYRNDSSGKLFICVQPLNSQWPNFHPIKTREEILEHWA